MPRPSLLPSVLLGALFAAVALMLGWDSFAAPLALTDGDGWMHGHRIQLRDLGLDPDFVVRGNAPDGFIIHWTAPFDLLLIGLRALVLPFAPDPGRALEIALLLSPVAMAFLLMSAVAALGLEMLARLECGRGASWIVLFCTLPLAVNVAFHQYISLGRADHHLLVAAMTLWSAVAALRASTPIGFALAGALAGLAVWTSVEALPFTILLTGTVLVGRGLAGEAYPRHPATFFAAMTGALVASVVLDPAYDGSRFDIDRVSLVHASLPAFALAACFIIGLVLALRPRAAGPAQDTAWPLWGTVAAGSAGALTTILVFPGLLGGPETVIGPYLHAVWWNGIAEIKPPRDILNFIGYLGLPAMAALLAAAGLASHAAHKGWRAAAVPSLMLLALTVPLALGAMHIRFAFWTIPLSVVGLAMMAGSLQVTLSRGIRIALLATALPGAALILALKAGGVAREPAGPVTDREISGTCSITRLAEVLEEVGARVVMSEVDTTAELLFRNQEIRTLGGSFQRNVEGLTDTFRILRDTSSDMTDARTMMAARGVTHLALCTNGAVLKASGFPAGSFMMRMKNGASPGWLEPVVAPEDADGYTVWRLAQQDPAATR